MIDLRQQSKDILLAELEAAGARFKNNQIYCPFHSDENPSGSVFQGDDGVWRYRCFGCDARGDSFDIEAKRTRKPLSEVLKKYSQKPSVKTKPNNDATFAGWEEVYSYLQRKFGGQLGRLYEYREASGNYVQHMIRWVRSDGKKEMRPAIETDGNVLMKFPAKRVLYRLPEIMNDKFIIVVEGEKKCDLLADYGFQATTSSGGALSASKTDWTPLAGKQVIIWPDGGTAGEKYSLAVQEFLQPLIPIVQIGIIDPAKLDLIDGEGVDDYIKQLKVVNYNDTEIKHAVITAIDRAERTTGPATELAHYYDLIFNGKLRSVETGLPTVDKLLQFSPDTLNLVVGSPGASKSLLMLQLSARWIESGYRTAVYELEKTKIFHLNRVLAQRAGESNLTKSRWVEANEEAVREYFNQHKEYLDMIGRYIWTNSEKVVTQNNVIEWVTQRAENGFKILVIDPATIATRTAEPYKSDELFVQNLLGCARKHQVTIFLVLHPSKVINVMPDLMAISGGSSYNRYSDNAIWLENHNEGKMSRVATCCGTTEIQHNRTLWILKSRDGSGTGIKLAMDFDKTNLCLSEQGIILRKQSQANTA